MHTEDEAIATSRQGQAPASPPSSFPQFMCLPSELRIIIWDLALPRGVTVLREQVWQKGTRHIEIWEMSWLTYATYVFDPPQPPPAVAQACREAREVSRPGRMFGADNTKNIPPDLRQRYPVGNRVQSSWFDPDRDTLLVHLDEPNESYARTRCEAHGTQAIGELARSARHVILGGSGGIDAPHCFTEALFNPRLFPCLQTIGLCTSPVTVESHRYCARLRGFSGAQDGDRDERFLQLPNDSFVDAGGVEELERKLEHLPPFEGSTKCRDSTCLRVCPTYLSQSIMWTPLDGLQSWPESHGQAPADALSGYVMEHREQPEGWDEDVFARDTPLEEVVLVPPPGWVDYAVTLSPKFYMVVHVAG
ncbi:hypothetical protein PG999_003053 [Apiospora kogelbergensis]|uniref:2EXR domain-containing protein n=1 Tax=Apiospora kogelbergensis TaxID=1337665 RepID=A0AAW0RA42_9PEZI